MNTNIPHLITPIIGRHQQTTELIGLLKESRLLTLSGPGGIGKTSLAIHVAHQANAFFSDGIQYVGLSSISAPHDVLPLIAYTLGVAETPNQPLLKQLITVLKEKHMLLVLDNFEHVLEATPTILTLLTTITQLHIMITSRIVLHLPGEQEYAVPALELPPANRALHLNSLIAIPAVQLFMERARAVRHDFQATTETILLISEVCRRLEGIPLAIELAAARVKILTPLALLQRLDQRLELLTRNAMSISERRHQSLRAAIAWSYDLLTEREQRLFRWMSVFVDGFTLESATALWKPLHADDSFSLLDSLASLIDKSLLQQRPLSEEPRFIFLETIREYAWEQVMIHHEADILQQYYAEFFADFAQQAASEMTGINQHVWMRWLTTEHDNLRAVLHWAQQRHQREILLRLGASLWRFWLYRGYIYEGRMWLEAALALLPDIQQMGIDTGIDIDIHKTIAHVLQGAGHLAREVRDYARATHLCQQSLEIYRQHHDAHGIAATLGSLGIIAYDQGDLQAATAYYEDSLAISCTLDDHQAMAIELNNLGILAGHTRDYARARALYDESLTYYQAVGNIFGKALCLNNIGTLLRHQGDYGTAQLFHSECLKLMADSNNTLGIGSSLAGLVHIAVVRKYDPEAIRFIAALFRVYESIGKPTSWEMAPLIGYLDQARTSDDVLMVSAAWNEGENVSLEDLVRHFLDTSVDESSGEDTSNKADAKESGAVRDIRGHDRSSEEANKRTAAHPVGFGLSLREHEVLDLIVAGLTNKAIAARLSISIYTVGDHVSAIFRKLGVSSRSAATRIAIQSMIAGAMDNQP